jgi:hypothetical protein
MKVTPHTTGIEYWDGISDRERLALFTSNDELVPLGYEDNELRFVPFFKLPKSVKEEIYDTLKLTLTSPSFLNTTVSDDSDL